MTEVALIATGAANLASVRAGLRRAGVEAVLVEEAAELARFDRAVLPGVGAFGPAMAGLRASGLADALRVHAQAKPLLAICLGLQLLFEGSDESPDVPGLGLFAGRAARFPTSVTVPQMGWNRVEPSAGCRLLEPGHAYFANSFAVRSADAEVAMAEHGEPFVAALEQGPLLACQFHPELSGAWGQALLNRWLAC